MSAITLTNLGKSVAENTHASGPEQAVLSLLYETGGPVDFDEICDELRTDEEKASMICRRLLNKGYCKEL